MTLVIPAHYKTVRWWLPNGTLLTYFLGLFFGSHDFGLNHWYSLVLGTTTALIVARIAWGLKWGWRTTESEW
jgi:hypothetical protein